jgi:hypothetical protein
MPDPIKIYPCPFPHDLQKKPQLKAEKLVYDVLSTALDTTWTIFYDWAVKGTRRRIDFLCINPTLGIAAFEVKGGMVHNAGGKFRQLINKKTGRRKIVNPFHQVKLGFNEIVSACGIDIAALPACHLAIFYPEMWQSGFTFTEGAHIFTQEDLDPDHLQKKLFNALHNPSPFEREKTAELLIMLKTQRRDKKK